MTSVTTSYRYPGMGYTFHLPYSYPGEVYDFCTTSYPTRGRFISSVQHHSLPESHLHTLTRHFCDFCTNFVPVPGYGVFLSYRTWRISVTSVQYYTLPDKFCDFCTTFIPLPDSSVTSVTNLIPYRKYPYPIEHNLVIIPSLVQIVRTGIVGT